VFAGENISGSPREKGNKRKKIKTKPHKDKFRESFTEKYGVNIILS